MNTALLILILKGFLVTVLVSVASAFFGLFLGIIFLGLQKIPFKPINWLFETLLMLIRGLPEIVIIFLVYFGGSEIIFQLDFNFDLDPIAAGLIALSLIFAAYASQSLRGAIEAIPPGQWLAARALGLSSLATFFDIILPQMWRQALPGLRNQWLSLMKDSSLVSTIGVGELMFYTGSVIKVTHQPFTFYCVAALLYLALTIVSSALIAKLDNRVNHYLYVSAKKKTKAPKVVLGEVK